MKQIALLIKTIQGNKLIKKKKYFNYSTEYPFDLRQEA
jgi:hypothetical protein